MTGGDLGHADPQRPAVEQRQLTLEQIWSVLCRRKKIVMGLPIVATAASLAVILLVDPQWEASGMIQIGKVGGSGSLVEPVQRSVERLKLRSFENLVLAFVNIPTQHGYSTAALYRASKRVRHVPDTDLIELRLRSYTAGDAVKLVEGTVTTLRRTHDVIAEPSLARLRQLLVQTKTEYERVGVKRDSIERAVNRSQRSKPADPVSSFIVLSMMQQLNADMRDLQTRAADLEERLSQQHTYPTSLLGDVQVSERPVFPKSALILVLSALVGLMVGMIMALVWNAFRPE